MEIMPREKTVIRTHDPADGDKYVTLLTVDGASLTPDPSVALTIDGRRYAVVRRSMEINARASRVTTTVTVVEDPRD